MFAHKDRVLVTLGRGVIKGSIVSKVNDVDAYVVALTGRRITVPGTQLQPNTPKAR